jgi:diketogulonate reductase-like aldo/keto reductase
LSSQLVLDTAQAYKNEIEAGVAIRKSGLKREEIYVTTKYSGLNGLDVQTSIRNSLKSVGAIAISVMFHCRLTSIAA